MLSGTLLAMQLRNVLIAYFLERAAFGRGTEANYFPFLALPSGVTPRLVRRLSDISSIIIFTRSDIPPQITAAYQAPWQELQRLFSPFVASFALF